MGVALLWKFHYYICDREFSVITDHQPLTKLLSSNPTARIQRWLLQLQPYNYIIKYDSGYMNASDVVSRNPLPIGTNAVSKDTEHFIYNIIDAVPLSVSLDEIKIEKLWNPDLCSIIRSVNTNLWGKKILPTCYRVRNDLIVKNSILLKSNRLVIPKLSRKRIIDIAHQHNLGIVKTKELLTEGNTDIFWGWR